jgi:hypothetical protein
MIWESCYWKEPLLEDRRYLLRFRCTDTTSEKTLAGLEKRIFLSFYSVRKLIEANRLSTKNINSNWPLLSYPNKSKVDLLNWHRIDEKYNLEKVNKEKRNLLWLCNQVIHSFVFILNFDDYGKLSGFYVSSDRLRNKKLYQIERKQYLDILKLIGNDYPANSKGYRNKSGDWIFKNW